MSTVGNDKEFSFDDSDIRPPDDDEFAFNGLSMIDALSGSNNISNTDLAGAGRAARREGSTDNDHADPFLGDDAFGDVAEQRPSTVVDPALLSVPFDQLPKSRPPPHLRNNNIHNNNNINNSIIIGSTQTPVEGQPKSQKDESKQKKKKTDNSDAASTSSSNDGNANEQSKINQKGPPLLLVLLPKGLSDDQSTAFHNPNSLAFHLRDLSRRNMRMKAIHEYREKQAADRQHQKIKLQEEQLAKLEEDDRPLYAVVMGAAAAAAAAAQQQQQQQQQSVKQVDARAVSGLLNSLVDAGETARQPQPPAAAEQKAAAVVVINKWTASRRIRWTAEETETFYTGLQQFGTNFAAITRFFPERDRCDVVKKYQSEKRTNPVKVRDALENLLPIDEAAFEVAAHAWTRRREMQNKGPLDETAENFLLMAGVEGAAGVDSDGAGDDDDDDDDHDDEAHDQEDDDGLGNNISDRGMAKGGQSDSFDLSGGNTKRRNNSNKNSKKRKAAGGATRQRQQGESELDADFLLNDGPNQPANSAAGIGGGNKKTGKKPTSNNKNSSNGNNNNNNTSYDAHPFLDPDDIPFAVGIAQRNDGDDDDDDDDTPLALLYPSQHPGKSPVSNSNSSKPAAKKSSAATAGAKSKKDQQKQQQQQQQLGHHSMMSSGSFASGSFTADDDFNLPDNIAFREPEQREDNPFALEDLE